MKKITCLGLAVMMVAGTAGCGSREAAAQAEQQQTAPVEEAVPVSSPTEEDMAALTKEDFQPFFSALFSFTEEQFDTLNQNGEPISESYFENLNIYRKEMNDKLGRYLADETLDILKNQSTKLDFDLPKKSQINDYVVDASGDIKDIEVKSLQEMDDKVVYEVAVTTTNEAVPIAVFAKNYEWNKDVGSYVKREIQEDGQNEAAENTEATYIYAQGENAVDKLKLVSTYQVATLKDKDKSKEKICGLKQGGKFEVDVNSKQLLSNTSNIQRLPYYDEATEAEAALIKKMAKAVMEAPIESYQYYDHIYGESFELVKTFWNDMGMANDLSLDEQTYEKAFDTRITPYKDSIRKIMLDEGKIQLKPSIYSTQLQPAFVAILPVQVMNKDNTMGYELYKYFVEIENGKIEAFQLMKIEEITKEQYEQGVSSSDEQPQETEEASAPPADQNTAE